MKIKLYTNSLEISRGAYSFIQPQIVEVIGELTENAVAVLAANEGVIKGKTFMSTGDDKGCIIVGKRYVPLAVAIPEGHPSYNSAMVLTQKMPK